MHVALLFPTLPPRLDGIGDYTARLAATLGERVRTTVLTAQPDADPIPGVDVDVAFSKASRKGVLEVVDAVANCAEADRPDWVVVQYNPFSYGTYGLNPWLPLALRQLRRRCPGLRIALMIHEPFVPLTTPTYLVETLWQRPTLWALGRVADAVFTSIAPWAERFARWFDAPVRHLPIGSNIPLEDVSRDEARAEFGLADTFAVGLFGSGFTKGMDAHVRQAILAILETRPNATLCYVGRRGAALREALATPTMRAVPFRDLGPLPADAVSRAFTAFDLYLAPYPDGFSTRRGSTMVALQHGTPTATTLGHLSDPLVHAQAGHAFAATPSDDPAAFAHAAAALVVNEAQRDVLGVAARDLYAAEFAWPHVADRLLAALGHDATQVPTREVQHA
ncbi:MAG: glycosyltransferase family 4 protein [Bacteroidota bacterium]